jgi:hypothetical protein
MGKTQHHLSSSIEGLLKLDDAYLSRLFCADGRAIRIELNRRKTNGHLLIPSENCDGFDPVNGCPGHPIKEKEVPNA